MINSSLFLLLQYIALVSLTIYFLWTLSDHVNLNYFCICITFYVFIEVLKNALLGK